MGSWQIYEMHSSSKNVRPGDGALVRKVLAICKHINDVTWFYCVVVVCHHR
jgi:hypothetical protein